MIGWSRVFRAGVYLVPLTMVACAESRPPHPRSANVDVPATDSDDDSENASDLIAEGDRLLNRDVGAAVQSYQEALRLTPEDHALLYKLALAYERQEAWGPMIEVMARAAELAPDFASYHFRYGYALYRDEQYGKAGAQFEACLEADPNLAGCEYYRGEVCLQLSDDQCALERFTAAIRLDPTRGSFYPALAELYQVYKRYAEAEQVLVAATHFLPAVEKNRESLYAVYVELYQVAQASDNTEGMLAAGERALEYGGDAHPEIGFVLGATHALATPPRTEKATRLLNAFIRRACRGPDPGKFEEQCHTAHSLLQVLGQPPP